MRRVLPALWAVGVLTVSAAPIAAGYAAWWAMLALAGCVIVPSLLVGIARWVRIPSVWIAVGVGMLGIVAATAWGPAPAASGSPGPMGVLSPLIDAVPRLLTAPRPAPAQIDLLAPAGLLVWMTSLGVLLAVTTQGRARIAPLIGALILQGAGALLTAGTGDPLGIVAATSVLLLLAGWLALPSEETDRERRSAARPQTGWFVGLTASALVALLAVSAAGLVGGAAFEPRRLIVPPPLPAEANNPLPDVPRWNAAADDELFMLTVSPAIPDRIPLAVLPDFDGASWTLDGRLRQVGVVADEDLPAGRWSIPVSVELEPLGIDTVWVPSIGRAVAVSDAGVLMDADTGSLVAVEPIGAVITVEADLDAAPDTAIAQAGVPTKEEAARYLALPRIPTDFIGHAEAAVAGSSARWEQVAALAEFVRGERVLDEGAPSGSSYGRIAEFLFASADAGGQVGTTEQFAASFALLARAVGIPTRLVVGFAPPAEDSTVRTEVTVTGADARVWAEVYLTRVGWVAVDPSPDSAIRTEHIPPVDDAGGTAALDDPQSSDGSTGTTGGDGQGDAAGAGQNAVREAVPFAAALLAAVLVVPVVWLVILRARRRRRWRAGGSTGAWALVLDALTLSGRAPAKGATAETIAADIGESTSTAGEAARTLAARAQRAAFGPPVAGRPVDAPSADGSPWSDAVQIERALRASSTPWRRIVWHLSPRVLTRS